MARNAGNRSNNTMRTSDQRVGISYTQGLRGMYSETAALSLLRDPKQL